MNCKECYSHLPDLLLDPTSINASRAKNHLSGCLACLNEFSALQDTVNLLDAWEAPEPSAWFDQRLAVRLRQEQALAPESWLERLRSRILFSTGRQLRPAVAGVLAVVLTIGGGTFVSVSGGFHTRPATVSATVEDLQILDRNDQAFQTMDMLQDDTTSDDGAADTPNT